jgi:hypothetical protein
VISFEILLPLFFNDGRPIEREKFLQTDNERVQRFGATSTDTVAVRGRWLYGTNLTASTDAVKTAYRGVPPFWREVLEGAPQPNG